jgi:hypothetical protein
MASTVVEALVLEFALDPSAFKAGADEIDALIAQLKDKLNKESNEFEKSVKKVSYGIEKLFKDIGILFGIHFTLEGFKNLITDTVESTTKLGLYLESVNLAKEGTTRLMNAFAVMNVDSDTLLKAIGQINADISNFNVGKQGLPSYYPQLLAITNIAKNGMTGIKALQDLYTFIQQHKNVDQVVIENRIKGTPFGNIQGLVYALKTLPQDDFNRLIQQLQGTELTDPQFKAAFNIRSHINALSASAESLYRTIMTKMEPWLIIVIDFFKQLVDWTQKLIDNFDSLEEMIFGNFEKWLDTHITPIFGPRWKEVIQAVFGPHPARDTRELLKNWITGEKVGTLKEVRQSYAEELKNNPKLKQDLFDLAEAEVGGQGVVAKQAFMESVLNRAAARGQTLAQAIHDRAYYPNTTMRKVGTGRGNRAEEQLMEVFEGSNISNWATGNASHGVGFAGGPKTLDLGTGDYFGTEGPDLKWVSKMKDLEQKGKSAGPSGIEYNQKTGRYRLYVTPEEKKEEIESPPVKPQSSISPDIINLQKMASLETQVRNITNNNKIDKEMRVNNINVNSMATNAQGIVDDMYRAIHEKERSFA